MLLVGREGQVIFDLYKFDSFQMENTYINMKVFDRFVASSEWGVPNLSLVYTLNVSSYFIVSAYHTNWKC